MHFAGFIQVEESVQQPGKYFENNTDNAIKLFNTCKNNGIKINNNPVTDDKIDIKSKDFNNENILKLSFGKKKHVIFKIN